MARTLGRLLSGGGGGTPTPPAGFFASPTGGTGAGTYGDPWSLTYAVAGGGGAIGAGDTIWLRGGTYIGDQWICTLDGTSGNPITFRAYPGERAIIDGNYDNAVTGNNQPTIKVDGDYQIWRDLEVFNSMTDRFSAEPGSNPSDGRGDGFHVYGKGSKVINCVVHDNGQGLGIWGTAHGAEIYGNVNYHNGLFSDKVESDSAAIVDLSPAGGSQVASSGTHSTNAASPATQVTISHHHVGDYLFVAAFCDGNAYTTLSATWNGSAMTAYNGVTNPKANNRSVRIFGVATGAVDETHDVVITTSGAATRIFGVAQSFENVHQTTPPTAAGTWTSNEDDLDEPPLYVDVSSDTNHLVVDAAYFYLQYGKDYITYGDNTALHTPTTPSNSSGFGLSTCPGVNGSTVRMGWTWTPLIASHGHGMYIQEGTRRTDLTTSNGDATVTCAANPWAASNVGDTIEIVDGVSSGVNLVTTIASFNGAGSIELTVAPTATFSGNANGAWGSGKLISDNLVYDQIYFCSQSYGTGNAALLNVEHVGNVFAGRTVILGGEGSFIIGNSSFHDNYMKTSDMNLGYLCSHMDNFSVTDNEIDGNVTTRLAAAWDDMVVGSTGHENLITGTFTDADDTDVSGSWPDNTYDAAPATNVIVVRANAYETNRANIIVYNWESSATVDVDLDAAVADNTPIYVMNAQDYYGTPVYSGTYQAGVPVSLPMTGLTVAAVVGYDATHYSNNPDAGVPDGTTAPAFAAFVVRAQSQEPWR